MLPRKISFYVKVISNLNSSVFFLNQFPELSALFRVDIAFLVKILVNALDKLAGL